MNWRKSISIYALVIALLLSTLGAAFAVPAKGDPPPSPPIYGDQCGRTGSAGSTPKCPPPPPPSKPIIVAPTPPGGWQVK
jgi:hypothetical protein